MKDFASLQKSISDWMARTDLNPQIPDFIRIAETQLNNLDGFRVQEMICKVLAQIDGQELGLPEDYLGMRLLRRRDGEVIPQTPPSLLHDGSCRELSYCNLGQRLELSETVDQLDVDLFYYREIPPLDDTNTTNWLLNKMPSIYLYGSLLAASGYLKDDKRLPIWVEQYKNDVQMMIEADLRDRWSGTQQVQMA